MAAIFSMGCSLAGAEEPAADKSCYTLFNPTPTELMRELSADRPDKTESPFTVDAGHYQVEMDLVSYTYDRHNSERKAIQVDDFQFGNVNLKAGLLNNLDAQLVIESYNRSRTEDRTTGAVDKRSGFGDVTPRLKFNVWGNDGGRTSFAVLPFVKLPTNENGLGNNAVEGGVKFPLAVEVPNWDVAMMTEFDFNRDGSDLDYHTEYVNSISVGHKLIGDVSASVEFFSAVSDESGSEWVGTVDTWLTWDVTENFRLDGGVYIGVTRSADDLHQFVGMTWRY